MRQLKFKGPAAAVAILGGDVIPAGAKRTVSDEVAEVLLKTCRWEDLTAKAEAAKAKKKAAEKEKLAVKPETKPKPTKGVKNHD